MGQYKNKINCSTCLALVSLFYSGAMSATVREAIIYHLLKCDKCLDKYESYEHNHPEFKDVNVKSVIKSLRKNLQVSKDFTDSLASGIEIMSSFTQDSNTDGIDFNPTKWQDAASKFDIETLMNLKFFRDLIMSYEYKKSIEDIDYSEFYKYMASKIGKRVDLLEACLRKEYVTNS